MLRIRLSSSIALVIILTFIIAPSQAQQPDLPPLPSADVINAVITQTGGPTYTPLKTPKNIKQTLKTFGKVFEGVHKWVSKKDAISYIATGGVIEEVVLPLKNSGSHSLKPDMSAPGPDPRPGKVVGAIYRPELGTMILVAVFNPAGKPDKIRMYYANKKYYEYPMQKDKFNQQTEGTFDEGAILSYNQSCVTVGKNQVCWGSGKGPDARDDDCDDRDDECENLNNDDAEVRIENAIYKAQNAYDLNTQFLVEDAVPDLIGNGTRANCAAALKNAVLPEGGTAPGISACDPNLYISASTMKMDDEPIVIWVVDQQADLKGFTYSGNYLGYIPAGEYLVVNATPHVTTSGQIGVLMLVNINDYNNHYLIPSIRMQQFADRKQPKNQIAAIKDGATWYYGW
jgi:hypothetical protein